MSESENFNFNWLNVTAYFPNTKINRRLAVDVSIGVAIAIIFNVLIWITLFFKMSYKDKETKLLDEMADLLTDYTEARQELQLAETEVWNVEKRIPNPTVDSEDFIK